MLAQVFPICIQIVAILNGGAIDINVRYTPFLLLILKCACCGIRYRQHDDDGIWDIIFVIIVVVVIVVVVVVITVFNNLYGFVQMPVICPIQLISISTVTHVTNPLNASTDASKTLLSSIYMYKTWIN